MSVLLTIQDDGRILFAEHLAERFGIEAGCYVLFDEVRQGSMGVTFVSAEIFEKEFRALFEDEIPADAELEEYWRSQDPELVSTIRHRVNAALAEKT